MSKDNRTHSRVVFLDYDGVVNTPMWNEKGTKCSYSFPKDGKVNNFQAVQWVSEFCQKCHYSIVVTSTWRKYENYQQCLINGRLRKGIEILGRTEITDNCRGQEIANYLKLHPEIKYYLILDDENDMLPEQQSHFVQTETLIGFGMKEYEKCLKVYIKDKSNNGSSKDKQHN